MKNRKYVPLILLIVVDWKIISEQIQNYDQQEGRGCDEECQADEDNKNFAENSNNCRTGPDHPVPDRLQYHFFSNTLQFV